MPSFVSHMVMAKDVFNKIDKDRVDIDYMITYSLGGDLCKGAKCRYDSHHKNMDKFISDMNKYIIDNNLTNDKEVMGVLYGHICHYVMDREIHPLVRKIDKICMGKRKHYMIEEYYDNYLVYQTMKIKKKEYLSSNVFKGKVNKKISKLLNDVYRETYNTKNVANYYKFNLLLYRLLNRVYKIFNINLIEKVTGLRNFLNTNKYIDLLNSDNDMKYRNYLGNEGNDSLIVLYFKSVNKACEYIKEIDKNV